VVVLTRGVVYVRSSHYDSHLVEGTVTPAVIAALSTAIVAVIGAIGGVITAVQAHKKINAIGANQKISGGDRGNTPLS
jgi:aminoglycoside N3'-acetyltransferase